MQAHASAVPPGEPDAARWIPRSKPPRGVYVADGYGLAVRVERRHLVVEDGYGSSRRVARFHKATSGLERLVVLGHSGVVTLEAVRWLHDAAATLVQVDVDGRVLGVFGRQRPDDARLRRAQARAIDGETGLRIARHLLGAKLAGQARTVAQLPTGEVVAERIRAAIPDLDGCESQSELRLVEAHAANAYWSAWQGLPVRFARKDASAVPEHWLGFRQRVSPLSGSPRLATDPVNASLNLLYALAEAEARIACLHVGLDPGMGVTHTDQPARDSLALDLLEPVRPLIDAYLLDLVCHHVFTRRDFTDARTGTCRLLAPLTHTLAATSPTWAHHLAPHAEHVAAQIAADAGLGRQPTRLTGQTRRAARPTGQRTRTPRPAVAAKPDRVCVECGVVVPATTKRCPACHQAANLARLATLQAAETLRRRETGDHPSQRADVREKIGATHRAHQKARAGSDHGYGFTGRPSEFRRVILPGLAGAPTRDLVAATGLSAPYCAQIRAGQVVPHVRHWGALRLVALRPALDIRTAKSIS